MAFVKTKNGDRRVVRMNKTFRGLLGHRDPRMTMRYQHLAPEHMKEVMET